MQKQPKKVRNSFLLLFIIFIFLFQINGEDFSTKNLKNFIVTNPNINSIELLKKIDIVLSKIDKVDNRISFLNELIVITNKNIHSDLYYKIAVFYELKGNSVEAIKNYQKVIESGKNINALIYCINLLIEQNEKNIANSLYKKIPQDQWTKKMVKENLELLKYRIKEISFNDDTIKSNFSNFSPSTLLLFYFYFINDKETHIAELARRKLFEKYSKSPEAIMIKKGYSVINPSLLLADSSNIKMVQEDNPKLDEELIMIQVGSFSIKENALNHEKEIKNKGFDCIIKVYTINNKSVYKTIIPNISLDELQTQLYKLKEKKIEGFPLY